MSVVPDLIEPFIGWKGLHANRDGQLFSPQTGSVWPGAAPFEAECSRADHRPPVRGCACGVYAVMSFEDLRCAGYHWNAAYHSPEHGDCIAVVAEVKLWGRIRKGSIGYRAEFAYRRRCTCPRGSCCSEA